MTDLADWNTLAEMAARSLGVLDDRVARRLGAGPAAPADGRVNQMIRRYLTRAAEAMRLYMPDVLVALDMASMDTTKATAARRAVRHFARAGSVLEDLIDHIDGAGTGLSPLFARTLAGDEEAVNRIIDTIEDARAFAGRSISEREKAYLAGMRRHMSPCLTLIKA